MSIQDEIKNRRLSLDLTMKEVAEYVGVSEGTVSRWESGDISNMRRDKIYRLSKILQISPLIILGWPQDDTFVSSPRSSIELSPSEEVIIRKFRTLDDRGQAAVLNVLNYEYDSLTGEEAHSSAKEA